MLFFSCCNTIDCSVGAYFWGHPVAIAINVYIINLRCKRHKTSFINRIIAHDCLHNHADE